MKWNYVRVLMAGAASLSLAACTSWLYGDQESAAGGSTSAQTPQQAGGQQRSQAPVPPAAGERLVRNVQQQLQAKGMDPGAIDGIWGPKTQDALEQFQRDQGLKATGQLNAPTLTALGVTGEENASTGGSAGPSQDRSSQRASSQGASSQGASSQGRSPQDSAFQRADLDRNGSLDREEFDNAIKLRQSASGASQ